MDTFTSSDIGDSRTAIEGLPSLGLRVNENQLANVGNEGNGGVPPVTQMLQDQLHHEYSGNLQPRL